MDEKSKLNLLTILREAFKKIVSRLTCHLHGLRSFLAFLSSVTKCFLAFSTVLLHQKTVLDRLYFVKTFDQLLDNFVNSGRCSHGIMFKPSNGTVYRPMKA